MEKNLEEKTKKHFIVALPEELHGNINIPGYEDIEKISGTHAGSPQSAVSHYLHRVHPLKAKLIVDVLNRRMGGAENYAFEIPEIEALNGKNNYEDKKLFSEMALASELAIHYGSKDPMIYLDKARELLDWFGDLSTDIAQA